jgi:hypothetical protein
LNFNDYTYGSASMEDHMLFTSAERPALLMIVTLAILDSLLILLKGVRVDVEGYAVAIMIGGAVILAGQFYRHVRRDAHIAMTLTAAGLFIFFTLAGSVFNYMLLPVRFPIVDSDLVKIDAMMGYHWPAMVEWVSHWPIFGNLLQVVYFSSLPQLVLVMLVLGFSGKTRDLQHFLLTGVVGATLCMILWSFFPSFGASSVHSLPAQVMEIVRVAVGPEYGAKILRLGQEGVSEISPKNVLGLIGFPSFHTIMACMSVVFLFRFRWLFPPTLLLNVTMIPAILVHGGHHLSDFLGGLAVFVFAYALAGKILRDLPIELAAASPDVSGAQLE